MGLAGRGYQNETGVIREIAGRNQTRSVIPVCWKDRDADGLPISRQLSSSLEPRVFRRRTVSVYVHIFPLSTKPCRKIVRIDHRNGGESSRAGTGLHRGNKTQRVLRVAHVLNPSVAKKDRGEIEGPEVSLDAGGCPLCR